MHPIVKTLARLAPLLLIFSQPPVTHATSGQPGTLDPTWATASPLGAGKVITSLTSGEDKAYAIALQPDGKLLVAGECFAAVAGGGSRFCALRYNANGTLDTSFGSAGFVITAIGNNDLDRARSIVLQLDRKIVLAGRCDTGPVSNRGTIYDLCAARYLPNGALDTTFGTDGKVITKVGVKNYADDPELPVAVAVQPDGKLVLASSCHFDGVDEENMPFSDIRLCTLRYHANGTLDLSFGAGGSVLTKLGNRPSAAFFAGLVVQQDGTLVAGSSCFFSPAQTGIGTQRFCATRYLANGTPDLNFGGTGTGRIYVPTTSEIYEARAIAVQADGKLLLAGSCIAPGITATSPGTCIVRLNDDGTVDMRFGGIAAGSAGNRDGEFITPVGAAVNSTFDEYATAVSLQPDGKLLLAGRCVKTTYSGPNTATQAINFCVSRHHSNGALDASFGTAGKVSTQMGSAGVPYARAAILQSDGKLLVAGDCSPSNAANNEFCAARYDGGPFSNQHCKPDIDGDGEFLATTDALIYARLARGVTGSALIGGITFPTAATRKTWPQIRDYLVTQCGVTLAP